MIRENNCNLKRNFDEIIATMASGLYFSPTRGEGNRNKIEVELPKNRFYD